MDKLLGTGNVRRPGDGPKLLFNSFKHSRYYSSYLAWFKSVITTNGVGNTLENYVFSPAANGNGADMLARFFGGMYV